MEQIVIYARVSGNSQDCQSQIKDLQEFCKKMNWKVRGIFQEEISGAKKLEDRIELQKALEACKKYQIKRIIVWEMSRLGRNASDVLRVIELAKSEGISIYIKQFNIETISNDPSNDIYVKMVMTNLLSFAEMERSMISQRLERGKKNYIASGGKLGRKTGQKEAISPVQKYPKVAKFLQKGISIRETSEACNVSLMTVQKVKKAMAI